MELTSMVELENEGAGPQCRQGKQPMVAASKKNQQEDEGAGTRKQMKKTNAQGRRRKGSNDEWNVNNNTIQIFGEVSKGGQHYEIFIADRRSSSILNSLWSDLDIQAANPSYTRAPSTVPENLGGPKFKIGTYYCKGAISPTADGRSGGKVELSSARSA
ncbi:hypothetical protein D0Y65_053924 [Glycine soja]|uniref:Uncharacterized protein n=1 Tax=Glycine soja TaxID=3848 RepID=A0A445F4A6_GLYSO|nr:hypothetical protein D0Y65_053924 [Glycine soja]